MEEKVKKNIDEKNEKILEEMEKISKKDKKSEKKKSDDKKEENKDTKKEEKKTTKKEEKKNTKKDDKVVKESWWHGVKSEFKKVRWPNKKEMVKYSIATICFILFFGIFFYIIELIMWFIQTA